MSMTPDSGIGAKLDIFVMWCVIGSASRLAMILARAIPVGETSVITGAGGNHAPMSAVHPNPLEMEKARRLQESFGAVGISDASYAPATGSVPASAADELNVAEVPELTTVEAMQAQTTTRPAQAAPAEHEPAERLTGTLQAHLQKRDAA